MAEGWGFFVMHLLVGCLVCWGVSFSFRVDCGDCGDYCQCLPACLSVWFFVCLYVWFFVFLFLCLFVCLFLCIFVSLSVCMFVSLSVWFFVCLFLCLLFFSTVVSLSVCLFACLSICLFATSLGGTQFAIQAGGTKLLPSRTSPLPIGPVNR